MKKIFLILCIAIFVGGIALYLNQQEGKSQEKSSNILEGVSKNEAVQKYLEENEEFNKPSFGGKNFVAYKKLGEKSAGNLTEQYLWVLAQEYFIEDGSLQKGTGISGPVLLVFVDKKIDGLRFPRDGNLYINDLREMFPSEVLNQPVFSSKDVSYHNQLVDELSQDVEAQARLFSEASEKSTGS